jgi:UDP-3-O-[3-hydroxymyristoyl] glucosamine N-acyltransferase
MGHKLNKPIVASELALLFGIEMHGEDLSVQGVSSLSDCDDGDLCFAKTTPSQNLKNKVVLIAGSEAVGLSQCLLIADNPRLVFAKVLDHLKNSIGFVEPKSPPHVDSTANVSPQAYIEAGVEIGPRSVVMPFAFIGKGVVIGADCIIKSGAIIGQDGYGFERDEDGLPIRLVHLGNVIVGNHVEIGSLTTICRGTLSNTIISDYSKIDDHVHIAHNVHVGVGAMVVACAEISGGVKLGAGSWIGPNASVIQKKSIGKNAVVGIGANVLKDVPDDTVVAGNPAKFIRFN